MFKNRKSKLIVSCTIVVNSIFIVYPSYAIDISDFFSSIINDIKSEVSSIQTWAKSEIDNTWAGIKEQASAALSSATGEMGAPDPIESGKELKNKIADSYSLPVAQEKVEDLERQLTIASIKSVIGKSGQENTAEKIDKTTQISKQAKSIADEAQQMNASQNILKAIASQNALVVSMLAQQRTDSLQSRGDTAYSNLMLTQIGSQIANQTKKENMQQSGLLSLNHEVAQMAVLDPAYIEKDSE